MAKEEYDLNGFRISCHAIPQTYSTTKDVWFVDRRVKSSGGGWSLRNVAQFDTEGEARSYTAIKWRLTE